MAEGWTTADYALIVSLCSAAFSLISLGWNVWSKFLFPKARISVVWFHSKELSAKAGIERIVIECTNFGPTDIVLRSPAMPTKQKTSLNSRYSYWDLSRVTKDTRGGKCIIDESDWPRKLAVGECLTTSVNATSLSTKLAHLPLGIGFLDTFDRFHTVPNAGYEILAKLVQSQRSEQADLNSDAKLLIQHRIQN